MHGVLRLEIPVGQRIAGVKSLKNWAALKGGGFRERDESRNTIIIGNHRVSRQWN